MTLSIRARLTAWYSLVVVAVLVTGAAAVALAQERLALGRLDAELQRLMLTLEGVVRTEFTKGLDLRGAADEASSEVLAPDRTLVLIREDGTVLALWGRPLRHHGCLASTSLVSKPSRSAGNASAPSADR